MDGTRSYSTDQRTPRRQSRRDPGDDVTIELLDPTSILTDSKPHGLPLVIQIVGADGSEILVSVLPRL